MPAGRPQDQQSTSSPLQVTWQGTHRNTGLGWAMGRRRLLGRITAAVVALRVGRWG
ncbi:hypothetical protein [Streptomyces sp. NPDC005012]|uniref:hypothetical protein n=1 Tax=unclassified Streptomyces TaxID=2593676 RepID=UPI0033B39E6E